MDLLTHRLALPKTLNPEDKPYWFILYEWSREIHKTPVPKAMCNTITHCKHNMIRGLSLHIFDRLFLLSPRSAVMFSLFRHMGIYYSFKNHFGLHMPSAVQRFGGNVSSQQHICWWCHINQGNSRTNCDFPISHLFTQHNSGQDKCVPYCSNAEEYPDPWSTFFNQNIKYVKYKISAKMCKTNWLLYLHRLKMDCWLMQTTPNYCSIYVNFLLVYFHLFFCKTITDDFTCSLGVSICLDLPVSLIIRH